MTAIFEGLIVLSPYFIKNLRFFMQVYTLVLLLSVKMTWNEISWQKKENLNNLAI